MNPATFLRSITVVGIAAVFLASAGAARAAVCNVPGGAYPTIQSAVNDSGCSTIKVAGGSYTEQVTIGRSLTLSGAGARTVIKAPSVLVPDADGFLNIVEINNGATVHARDLTVAGPGPGPCDSITSGIAVSGDALLDIEDATVRDIRDDPLSGCFSGIGILAGTKTTAGHLIAGHVLVTGYQFGGIILIRPGSTGQIHQNRIESAPSSQQTADGIVIAEGALATVDHNTVTGNQCVAAGCGPDWFTQGQSVGIFLGSADSGTTVSNNAVYGNDVGIYADSGGDIDHNDVSGNGDFGLLLDFGYASAVRDNRANGANSSCPAGTTSCDGLLVFATGATFNNNTASSNGNNGIEVSCYPGPFCGVGNTFRNNAMKGNGGFDAKDASSGSETAGTGNTWIRNNCATSSPSGLCR